MRDWSVTGGPPESLVALLRGRAEAGSGQPAYTFLDDAGVEAARMSFADLDRRARAIGAALAGRLGERAQGARALLLFPPGLAFVEAFLGCLYAGAAAVPAYPPRSNRTLGRLLAIARDARPAVALTTAEALPRIAGMAAGVPELAGLPLLATDEVEDRAAAGWQDPGAGPETLAFLQYTSGSTADPKGVLVTHGNLLHNEEMIRRAFGQSAASVIVGWLPLYHDMGLIGNVLQPLYLGARCVLMSPVAFLQRPERWLSAISQYRATTSGGPNFGYDLCVRRVGEEVRAGLDLSSWEVAFNGAEPVRAETLERFARTFGPCGFRKEAFYPCYGLAESTLFVSGGQPGSGATTAEFDAAALERDEARPAAGEEGGRRLVGCGEAWMGQEIAVVDRATGERCPAGKVGEIWVAGPSVAAGYWQRADATAETFEGRLADGSGPFLRTGDLGFFHGGELWVTGRLKDLIILRGRNLYPQDVELTAERSHPALRPGCSAAFAVEVPGESEERLAVVLEIDRHREGEAAEAVEAVRRAVAEEHEAQAHEVVLVRVGSIPKTSSGKIQRAACRTALVQGELKVVERSAVAPRDDEPGLGAGEAAAFQVRGGEGLDRAGLVALPAAERRRALVEWLRGRAAAALRIDAARISPDRPLGELGLDSLAAVELRNAAEETFGGAPSIAELLEGASLAQVAEQVEAAALSAPGGGGGGAGRAEETGALVHVAGVTEGPLSYGQRALFYLESLAPESAAYLIAGAARVRGGLDPAALRRALVALSARHPALCTTISVDGRGEPVQRVHGRLDPELHEEDASGWNAVQLDRRLAEVAWQPFDLDRGPLLRLALLRNAPAREGAGDGGDLLVLSIHHLIADFWSMEVLLGDLAVLYRSEASGDAAFGQALPPLPFSYLDFVRRQEATIAGLRGERLWEFWRGELGDRLPVLELPTDRPRPRAQSFRGAAVPLRLSAEAHGALAATARSQGATLFVALLAGFQALLARWSGQDELLVGAPTSGRDQAGLAGLVGYFVNPVVLRADLRGAPTGAELLARARGTALAAFAHQEFPFPLLAERLQPVRDPGRSPLFQAMCALQRAHRPELAPLGAFALGEEGAAVDLGGLALSSAALPGRPAQFDLSLVAAEVDGGLAGSLQVAADLFDPATARRLADGLVRLLEGLAADAGRPVAELPLLAPAELAQALAAAPPLAAPPEDAVLRVARQAVERPEAPAVVAADGTALGYGELDRRAGVLARRLRASGVGPEVPVGVCLEHVPERVIALLAVLRIGGAFLALDPTHPPARLRFQLRDAGAVLVLTDGGLVPVLSQEGPDGPGVEALALDAYSWDGADPVPVEPPLDPGQLAYLIYTSGSTGTPKASAIRRDGLAHLVAWHLADFPVGPGDRVTQLAGPAFDASVWEMWPALAAGAALHLVPRAEVADPPRLAARLVAREITSLYLPTPVAELFFADRLPLPDGLRHWVLGGDRLHRRPPAGLPCKVVNCYGPSEATVVSTAGAVTPEGEGRDGETIDIGRPLPGTRAVLLDRHFQPVPAGVVGELYLGGPLLGRGYLARPALTAAGFLPDPFSGEPGARLYRTGDRVRLLPDGTLDFLGRIDHQVKVRGVRIELGEVEAALGTHPAVRQAAALVRDEPRGGKSLVGYAVVDPAAPAGEAELRAYLRERLPEAMMPARLVLLDSLPLTTNGKPDRAALAQLAPEAGDGDGFVPPGTPVEEQLAALWREVLDIERVGIHDDFFALGGHSLKIGRLLSRVRDEFGVEVPPHAFLEAPTVSGLAQALARALMAEEDADDLAELLAEMDPSRLA